MSQGLDIVKIQNALEAIDLIRMKDQIPLKKQQQVHHNELSRSSEFSISKWGFFLALLNL